MRYFTPAEADALVPRLEELFAKIGEIRSRLEAKAASLRKLEAASAPEHEIAIDRSQAQFLMDGINEWAAQVEALGCVLKGIDPPLVDFPARIDGREVYLCWTGGETRITHYHGIEEGYAGRKPLPGFKDVPS